MPVDPKRTEKQRVRKVIADLSQFYPKEAIKRQAGTLQAIERENENGDPKEASKMLDKVLGQLHKAKHAKAPSTVEDMPKDYGREKTPAEVRQEEKIATRNLGEVATVEVKGQIVEDKPTAATPASKK